MRRCCRERPGRTDLCGDRERIFLGARFVKATASGGLIALHVAKKTATHLTPITTNQRSPLLAERGMEAAVEPSP